MSESRWRQFSLSQVLPHAGAMCLLDTILDYDPEGTMVCGVKVGSWSLFHDEQGALPAFVGLEFMAQTVSAYFGMGRRLAGEPLEVGFLLGTRRMAMAVDAFSPGQELTIEARKVYDSKGMGVFDCRILDPTCSSHGEEVAALMRGNVTVYRPENLAVYLEQQAADED